MVLGLSLEDRISYLNELWRILGIDYMYYSHLYCISFFTIIFIRQDISTNEIENSKKTKELNYFAKSPLTEFYRSGIEIFVILTCRKLIEEN